MLAVTTHPKEYIYGPEKVPQVLESMRIAFRNGTYNKDSRAIKATCKILGIKHTYKEINHFVANHV